jgi:16S rRNA (cytidine1402-2'-O)-methyltransferase
MNSGILYVVSTPIGNLEDITLRALRVLKEVDLVVSEDTRRTLKLLSHYGLSNKLLSYHEHNSKKQTDTIIGILKEGKSVALVSDAGTPCISDPGSFLVHRAREEGVKIVPVPGPSSVITALSASGLNFESFLFTGFLPDKRSEREVVFEKWRISGCPIVFFVSPHRILYVLDEFIEFFPDSYLLLFREMTKVYEEVIEGTPQRIKEELLKKGHIKGEFIGIISIKNKIEEGTSLKDILKKLLESGWKKEEIRYIINVLKNASRNEVYREFLKLKEGGEK